MRNILLALGHYHHTTHRGVARYAREHNWHLVGDMAFTAEVPAGWNGDGIITVLSFRRELVDFVLSRDVPRVDLSLTRGDIALPRVLGDNEAIGRLAAEHFLERGYRHFAWFSHTEGWVAAERTAGFSGALEEAGFAPEMMVWEHREGHGADTWSARRRWLIGRLASIPRPLAVFAYNDALAANMIDACIEGGIRVPEEVAVLGVDNDDLVCECLSVPLSSVCHDLETIGYEGAALLDRLIDGQRPPAEPVRVPPRGVVTRKSTDIIAVEHLETAKALRFIWENYHRPIGVMDVVAATSMSRRGLEKAFHTYISRSIHRELCRVRFEKVEQFLAESDLTVTEIAARTGFTRPQYLCNVFKRTTGTTPNQYRAAHRGS